MKVTVVHDDEGDIIAISEVVDLKQAKSQFAEAGIVPGKDQKTLDLELAAEFVQMPLRDIYRLYRVDRTTSKLVKRKEPREMPPVARR
jgi:hypothetical protein